MKSLLREPTPVHWRLGVRGGAEVRVWVGRNMAQVTGKEAGRQQRTEMTMAEKHGRAWQLKVRNKASSAP